MMRFGSFQLDSPRRQLLCHGREVHLTPKAFDLLSLLVEAAPRVVSKGELHKRLWRGGVVSDATLVGLVKEVRRALDQHDRAAAFVRTLHSVGYAFAGPLASAEPPARVSRWLAASERRLQLIAGENVIGRDPHSNVWIDDATISRRHARIIGSESGARIEDLGSKNGTTVGDKRIVDAMVLRDGDRIGFGDVSFTYRESPAGLPTVTQVSPVYANPRQAEP